LNYIEHRAIHPAPSGLFRIGDGIHRALLRVAHDWSL